jgi:hypothetical protein
VSQDHDAPAAPEPAEPEEPQTSVHAQTVGPEPATSDAPEEPAERTLEEESLRRSHSHQEDEATEPRRDDR